MKWIHGVRAKIWLCVNVAFAGLLVVSTATYFSNSRLADDLRELKEEEFPLALKISQVVSDFKKQSKLYEEGFLTAQAEEIESGNDLGREIIANMEQVLKIQKTGCGYHEQEARRIAALKEKFLQYNVTAYTTYLQVARGKEPRLLHREIEELGRLRASMTGEFEEVSSALVQSMERELTESENRANRNKVFVLLVTAGVLALAFIIVNRVASRTLITPLGELTRLARGVGLGEWDLSRYPTIASRGEIGELAEAFRNMTVDLQKTTVSKTYLNDILSNMLDSLVVVGADLNIQTVNLATLRLLGYEEGELIGKSIRQVVSEDFLEEGPCGGESGCSNVETVYRTRDGIMIPVLFSRSTMSDESGKIKGFICVAKDISERKAAEEKMKEQHRFLRHVFESIPQPFYVIDAKDYTVSLANSSARRDDYREKITCHELTHQSSQPCSSPEHLCPLREVVRRKAPVSTEHIHGERIYEVHGYPILDRNGQVRQMIEYSLDITERKRFEDALRFVAEGVAAHTGEGFFRSLVDHLTAVLNVRHALLSLMVNSTHGRALAFRSGDQYLDGLEYEMATTPCGEVIRTGEPAFYAEGLPAIFPGVRDIGAESYLGVPVLDSKGKILGNLAVLDDQPILHTQWKVSILKIFAVRAGAELERMEADRRLKEHAERLKESNRELEEFAYIASHDLQEPLRKVTAFGERLKAKFGDALEEQGRDYLERMQNAATRMQGLITGLLTFSRVTTKGQPFVRVDLKEVTREVLSDMEVKVEEVRGRVEIGNLPTVEADPLQMRQLIQNLVGNALKFSKPGIEPVVRLFAEEEACEKGGRPFWRVSISDNGIGIEEKYQERIFGIFQRLHGRDEYEGSGIGLAVCKKIMERHGGKISVRSHPGEGTTFELAFPSVRPDAVSRSREVPPIPCVSP